MYLDDDNFDIFFFSFQIFDFYEKFKATAMRMKFFFFLFSLFFLLFRLGVYDSTD